MTKIYIPNGLKKWNQKLDKIVDKTFPPVNEPVRKETPEWDKISDWALICEEILDTEPTPGILKQFYDELIRRGYSRESILKMRYFAWLTAGWLNFEKALWEWVHLDEDDILDAIKLQFKDGLINKTEKKQMLGFMKNIKD